MSVVELKHEDVWSKISSYPPSIRRGFEKLKESTQQYITNGYSDKNQKQRQFDELFLKEFSKSISKTQCMELSFAKAGGIKYGFGFKWANLKILMCYRKFLKTPSPNNGFFYFFKRDCKKGLLRQYEVSCWRDLLEISLKNHTYYRLDRQSFSGQKGIQRTKAHLQKLYEKNGKIPLSEDNGCKLIAKAIRRDIWKEFGITTWGDLVYEIFGFIKGTMHLWKGGGGLDRALSWIKDFFDKNGKLPGKDSDHYCTINQLVLNKFWKEYGITKWDDLTLKACGIVDSTVRRSKWKGTERLETARIELKKYYNDHQNKLPTASMFKNILAAISRGHWKEYNIESWNDMLMDIFGKINVVHKSWKGQVGLNRAKEALIEYKKKYKKLPKKNKSNRILGIRRALMGKYWTRFGIFTWEDLIEYTFHEHDSRYYISQYFE